MVGYIKQLASDLENLGSGGNAFDLLHILAEEIDRLDPRDFLPAGQYEFVRVRMRLRRLSRKNPLSSQDYPAFKKLGQRVGSVLDLFGGDGSRASLRSFDFINDIELKNIIERDYLELSIKLIPSHAWKSCVVIAGSILEAILYDVLRANPKIEGDASSAKAAPRGKDLRKGEWSLHQLIQVCLELGLLPKERGSSIDQILRDYRNFVHPLKEIRTTYPCTEAEAFLSKGALDAVCNHLDGLTPNKSAQAIP